MVKGGEGSQHAEGFTVKNTFIDFEDNFFEEDDGFDNAVQGLTRKRQVSEPAFLFARQLSSKPLFAALQEEEEQDAIQKPEGDTASGSSRPAGSDGDVEEEPETEREPIQPYAFAGFVPAPGGGAAAGPMVGSMLNKDAAPWPQAATFWGQANGGAADANGGDMGQVSQALVADFQPSGFSGQLVPTAPQPSQAQEVPAEWGETTTVMMRNLPNRYTQNMLVEEISSASFSGLFDFLYLPIDPETNANKGYAFINFVDNVSSWRFKMAFEGKQMSRFNSSKFVSVSPAALQGLEANHAHYSTARCSRGDPAARPIFLREPQQALASRTASGPSRRGGQRRRNNGRSLVDVAVQKQYAQQHQVSGPHQQPQQQLQKPQQAPQQPQAAMLYGGKSQGSGEAGPALRFCPFCGGSVQSSYRFCQYCGNSLAGLVMK